MRPWQRDVTAVSGLALISVAAFLESVTLGFLVVGVELVGIAFLLSCLTPGEENNDGDG